MIYGVNINGMEIPPGVKRKFASKVRLDGMVRGQYAHLKAVAQSEDEKNAAFIAMSNGSRKIHIVERQTAAGIWYGFYVW